MKYRLDCTLKNKKMIENIPYCNPIKRLFIIMGRSFTNKTRNMDDTGRYRKNKERSEIETMTPEEVINLMNRLMGDGYDITKIITMVLFLHSRLPK